MKLWQMPSNMDNNIWVIKWPHVLLKEKWIE